MTHPLPLRAALLTTCVLVLGACSKPEPVPEPIRSVKVMTVALTNVQSEAEFAGDVRARVESMLGFRVAGKLVKRQAEVGQRVRPGQVIAQVDPEDYKLAADAAKAQVEAATTNRDLAVAELKRVRGLKDQNFVSAVELDRREAAVQAANATLAQAQAQLKAQGNQSAYSNLLADAAGIVTGVMAEPGQVVGAGTPIVRVALDGARDVVFSVPEDKVAAMAIGSPVEVRLWSGGAPLKGTVREKAALADPVTRTFQIKVALDAVAEPPPLGSTVTVVPQALSMRGLQVMKLPTSALKQDGKNTAVWVLDTASMTVKTQPVQIAAVDGNDVVVGGGLMPGMQVVTAGVHVLNPGQKVTLYKPRTVSNTPPGIAPIAPSAPAVNVPSASVAPAAAAPAAASSQAK